MRRTDAVLKLSDLTFEEVRALDPTRVIAILPVGAIEAHGPHLPLNTDVIIAEAMARAGAERLAGHGYTPLLLPPVCYTPAGFAAAFPGTVSITYEATMALVRDIADGFASHGHTVLALANAHLDPTHVAALRAAVLAARERANSTIVFPDLTRRQWAERLTEEFRSGACHAGRYETSIVLAERPELVHDAVRATLEPNPASLVEAIRDGKDTFTDAGGPRAYFGWPADATAEEGRQSIETLGAILEEAVLIEVGK